MLVNISYKNWPSIVYIKYNDIDKSSTINYGNCL